MKRVVLGSFKDPGNAAAFMRELLPKVNFGLCIVYVPSVDSYRVISLYRLKPRDFIWLKRNEIVFWSYKE